MNRFLGTRKRAEKGIEQGALQGMITIGVIENPITKPDLTIDRHIGLKSPIEPPTL